jgi:hypothetical protein
VICRIAIGWRFASSVSRWRPEGKQPIDLLAALPLRLLTCKGAPTSGGAGKIPADNRKSHLNETQMVDGRIVMIPEIGEALDAFKQTRSYR